MDDYLSIFIRDELITWQNVSRKSTLSDTQMREQVIQNVDLVVKRAQALSCRVERTQVYIFKKFILKIIGTRIIGTH